MSTDLYGVRVLEVDEEHSRVRLRVFVVYYDTTYEYHQPVPNDRSFFVRVLCDVDALGDDISSDQRYDEGYVDRNAFRYVDRFVELERRNHPLESYEGYSDFYYERGGGWQDEEKLVQADYDLFVTKPEYVRAFEEGYSWGTTSYQTSADELTMEDYLHVPDFTDSRTFAPFADLDGEATTVEDLQFSEDGSMLLATHNEGGWRVFDLSDFSVRSEHVDVDDWNTMVGWTVDGRVAWREGDGFVAKDIETGEIEALEFFGAQSSSNGTRHIHVEEPSDDAPMEEESKAKVRDESGNVLFEMDAGYELMVYAGFNQDASRAVIAIETKSAHLVDLVERSSQHLTDLRINSIGMSPDGRYIVATTYGGEGTVVMRTADGSLVRCVAPDRGRIPTGAAWSMDGRLVATSSCDPQGYNSIVQLHRTGAAIEEDDKAPTLVPEARGDEGILDVARLYVMQTAAFSSGWSSHLDDDRMDMHLALQRMGLTEFDMVGHLSSVSAKVATRSYEAVIALARGDEEQAMNALLFAEDLLDDSAVDEWAMTFTYAPLAAAQWVLGKQEAAAASLERSRVKLEEEANEFQKRAVLCRALLTMGRTDEVREIAGDKALGWVSGFRTKLLVDLIDAGEYELFEKVFEDWGAANDWSAKDAVLNRLLMEGDSARAVLVKVFGEEAEPTEYSHYGDKASDEFVALCERGDWESAYAQIDATKRTVRGPMWQAVADAALERRDVHILVDALASLPCTDMNSNGLRALQSAFRTMAGRHYKEFHP